MVLVAAIAVQAGVAFASGRVSPSPASSGVTEGQSYNVVFTLDEPIIAPMGSPDPNVTLTFTPADPSRLSLSPPTIEWTPSEWFPPRTLQVTAVHDGIHDVSNTDVVQVTTTSGSEYYSGFVTSFTVVITDVDPTPTTTTTTTTATTTASTTGPTSTTARTTSTTTRAVTTTTVLAVDPGTGSLPATGAPIENAFVAGVVTLIAGLLLLRPRRARSRARPPRR